MSGQHMHTFQTAFHYTRFRLLIVFFFLCLINPAMAATGDGMQSPAANLIDKPFYRAVTDAHQYLERFQDQLHGFTLLPAEMGKVWQTVSSANSPSYPYLLIFFIFLTLSGGIGTELLLRRSLRPAFSAIDPDGKPRFSALFFQRVSAIILELIFLATSVLVTFFLYVSIFPEEGSASLIASNYILAFYYSRVVLFLLLIFYAPGRQSLRILPFSNKSARILFFWSSILCIVEILLARSGIILKKMGADPAVITALTGLIIISSTLIIAAMILQNRQRVTEELSTTCGTYQAPTLLCRLAPYWHVPALFLLLLMSIIWEIRVLETGKIHFGKIIVLQLAIPIFLSLDIWGRRLLQIVFLKPVSEDSSESPARFVDKVRGEHVDIIMLFFRTLLLGFLIFFFLGLFHIDIAIGRMFTAGIVSSLFIIILFYLAWQFFSRWINSKIKEEMGDQGLEMDEGGRGGSRRGTLLLLFRKFVLIILVIVAVMSILSSLGLNIAPLVAGAGIIGLAISFGAQSLVTDIFAGIFFLIDDAFRVGDYIDTGQAKGMVEHISLRAVRLRHHRGMVQTVPFGKIGTVVNFSRDYIIMKLDFRVRYDTDVDKVRKIVKRIYKELLADPEYGPLLIGKLKSQGVLQMDDSAMIMRIKFTTPPGEQFVMRKEVLRRLQEAFQANNIEFAHRNVTVYMPPENEAADTSKNLDKQKLQGAATAAILNEEQQAGPQKTDDR